MSGSVNKVILLGNLGSDPELRYTQSGTAVANFSLATNDSEKDGDGWKDRVEWHRITVWTKLAERCSEYLRKGSSVYLEGRLQTRKWQDKDGMDRYTTEIVAFTVQFLGAAGGGGGGGDRNYGGGGGGRGDQGGGRDDGRNEPQQRQPQQPQQPPAGQGNEGGGNEPVTRPSSADDDDFPFSPCT